MRVWELDSAASEVPGGRKSYHENTAKGIPPPHHELALSWVKKQVLARLRK